MFQTIIQAITGVNGSSETEGAASARWNGLITIVASLAVAYLSKNGVAVTETEMVNQITVLVGAGGSIYYGFGVIRAVLNWFHEKWANKV